LASDPDQEYIYFMGSETPRLVILIKNIYTLLGWKHLMILIKNIYTLWGRKRFLNIYTLWGRKRFLLPVTFSDESSIPFYSTSNGYKSPTNLVYPFTLRVTGIKIAPFPPTNLVYPFTLRVTGIKNDQIVQPTNLVYPFTLRVTGIKTRRI